MAFLRGLHVIIAAALSLSAALAQAEVRYEEKREFVSYLQRRNGPVIALLPGAGLGANRYSALIKEILAKDSSLNVLVGKFTRDYVNPLEAKTRVEAMLRHLTEHGWHQPNKALFLTGHSLGSVFAHGLATELHLGGLILMGGYLPQTPFGGSPYTVATYPLPILMMGGDMDGRVELWHQSRDFRSYEGWAASHPEDFSRRVITLLGVNHMAFADGHVLKGDLKAGVSLDVAHHKIAEVMGLFIRANTSKDLTVHDVSTLQDYVQMTEASLKPVRLAEEMNASLCSDAQKEISGLLPQEWGQIQVQGRKHHSFPSFVLDKSKISREGATRALYVPYFVEVPPNPVDVSGNELGQPVTIACKMRSRESIVQTFEFDSSLPEINCAALNQKVMERVFATLPVEQQLRYGLSGASFDHKLVRLGTGVQWVIKPFAVKRTSGTKHWVFEIPELKTSVDFAPAMFSGAHYCKLVAPERAMQWYTRDALLP